MEALEIRLSEEIMSEMDDACPLDIEFPLIMHFGGPNSEKRGTDCYAVYERTWGS
jgi:hypothetical protein